MNDRRAHQCHFDGCDTMARFSVRVHVECPTAGGARALGFDSTIKVCHRHRSKVEEYVLSPVNRYVIRSKLIEFNYPEPNFASARMEFLPIRDDSDAPVTIRLTGVACDRGVCTRPALWQVTQRFRTMAQRGKGAPSINVLTNLCVCDECRMLTVPADFEDQESRDATRRWLNARGEVLVDLDGMTIGFVPLPDSGRIDPETFTGVPAG